MTGAPDRADAKRAAGVVIDTGEGLYFVPAESALAALDNPRLSAVPGTALQMLWFEGRVVPAAAWSVLMGGATAGGDADAATPSERRASSGLRSESALVCELAGQTLTLVGVLSVASGSFEVTADGGVLFEAETVPPANLPELYRQAQALSLGRNESRDAAADSRDSRDDSKVVEDPK